MSLYNITVVIGNPSETSRTKVLALAIASALADRLPTRLQVLETASLAPHLLDASGGRPRSPEAEGALRAIASADLLVAASPVYKGSYTGLFKHLFDLVPPDALVCKPVRRAATGASDRHALVVDHQLRPLFAFFRALTVPSAVYAAEADFDGYRLTSEALKSRIDEAADQAAALLQPPRQHDAPVLRVVA